jgi:hypothetical protein
MIGGHVEGCPSWDMPESGDSPHFQARGRVTGCVQAREGCVIMTGWTH